MFKYLLITKQNFHHRYSSLLLLTILAKAQAYYLLNPWGTAIISHDLIPSLPPVFSPSVIHPTSLYSISSIPSIWYQNNNFFLSCVRVAIFSLTSFWFNAISFTLSCVLPILGREHYECLSFPNSWNVFLDN